MEGVAAGGAFGDQVRPGELVEQTTGETWVQRRQAGRGGEADVGTGVYPQ